MAKARLPWLAPKSKIVWLTVGAKVQVVDPALNRVDSAVLSTPPEPVSEMNGKNAARAAPMSAFEARSTSSDCSTSGRPSSTLELTASGSRSSTTTESTMPGGSSFSLTGAPTSSSSAFLSWAIWVIWRASSNLA